MGDNNRNIAIQFHEPGGIEQKDLPHGKILVDEDLILYLYAHSKISLHTMNDTNEWRALVILSSIFIVGLTVAYIVLVNISDYVVRGCLVFMFVTTISYIIWLSIATRDKDKKSNIDKFGKRVIHLENYHIMAGNVTKRLTTAWVFMGLLIAFYVVGLSYINLSGGDRMNGFLVEFLLILVTFLHMKSQHNSTDFANWDNALDAKIKESGLQQLIDQKA